MNTKKTAYDHGTLALKTKLGFGICDLGGNLFFTSLSFYLTVYLTDTVGLKASLMGIAIMAGRIIDAFSDPLMGYISDHTKSKWGRRRPYLIFGSLPLALSFILMFINPVWLQTQGSLFIWTGFVYFLMTTAYTSVNIPYSALTPELTRDYHQKTVLNGYRMSFAVIGTLVGAGAALPIVGLFGSRNTGYTVMAVIFGSIMALTAWITAFTVKEPERTQVPVKGKLSRDYAEALKDHVFLKILIPWGLFTAGVTAVTSSFIYFFKYVYRNESMTTPVLVVLLVTALAFIPVWVKVSVKTGKKNAYITGMTLFSATVILFSLTGDTVPVPVLFIYIFAAGAGLSTHYVMPYSLVPDAIENSYADTGNRKEGVFYGLWTFISKLGQAASVIVIGTVLTVTGYVPEQLQTSLSVTGIRLLTGLVPAIFIAAGISVLYRYPITGARYLGILEKINLMESENA